MQGHEGEILALTAMPGGEFLSSSLDQTISLWRGDEGKLRCSLPGVQEPANFVEYLEATNEVVIASTSNRITVSLNYSCRITTASVDYLPLYAYGNGDFYFLAPRKKNRNEKLFVLSL